MSDEKRTGRWRVGGLLGLALVCLVLIARQNRASLRMRDSLGLTGAPALENAPPLMAFTTVVLGGFRGILADTLWLRVTALQDKGRYFEIVQLADWITKLEPRSATIWAYHAWNMAYNISVTLADVEDRWRWVLNGVHLLRDEGLVYNPADPELFKELGWLFQHKIGADADPAHRFYKMRWAERVTRVLGSGRPDYETMTETVQTALRNELHMDWELMRQVDDRYGPLDWRLPQAHAVYWAVRGVRDGRGDNKLGCYRMVYQSLSELVRHGTLRFDARADVYEVAPAPELIPGAVAAFEEALSRYKVESIRIGYGYFLPSAARQLHALGREAEARELYARYRRLALETRNVSYEDFLEARGTK